MPRMDLPETAAARALEPEFAPHYDAWAASPSPQTASALVKAVAPVIKSALRTYVGQGQTSPTVQSRAKAIVLDSLPRYDPRRAKLRTHLMVQLQSLRRAGAEENQIISVPERVRLDQHRLRQATAELADRLGREPADSELSEHTGLALRRLAHIRKAQTSVAEGSLQGLPNEQGESTTADPAVVDQRDNDVWLRFVYQDLHPTDQFIMEHVLGLHGKEVLPKGEIARRLGLSAGAVSQRLARIQKAIDAKDELGSNLF
jgi:RNA polymerase sigma-B factor